MTSKIKLLKDVRLRIDIRTGKWRGDSKPHGAVPCPTMAHTTIVSSDCEPVTAVTLGFFLIKPTSKHPRSD